MSETIRISLTLNKNFQRNTVCCAKCNHDLVEADAGLHWKDTVPVAISQADEIPGWSQSIHDDLELRQFSCPACSALLDSEVALSNDPYLYDVVRV